MRVLVTGAAGFIGSHVTEELVARGHEVRAIDCFLEASYPAAEKRATWEAVMALPGVEGVVADLRDPLDPALLDGVGVVVNEAAMPGLMASWRDFSLYSTCNVHVVEQLARACTERDVHLVQVSTSSVYGRDAVGDELSPIEPTSPYGVTKLAAEELLRAYGRSFGTRFTILRYFSVYGPRQRPDMAYRLFIDAIAHDREIEIFGDGRQTRTNTYVDDCARATVEAALRQPTGETINVAGSEGASLMEALGHIEKAMGRTARIVHRDARPGDQRHTGGAIDKAERLLDWRPMTSLSDGLAAQVAWQIAARGDINR
jgi:nucleoside-diphosphate-sugar epimerase